MPKTLDELRARIGVEADFVGVKPYSHNIIALCLREIDSKHGRAAANQAIDDFELEELGWHKVEKTK